MDGETELEILGSAERACLIALTLHERLVKIDPGAARLARVIYLEASQSAERMGRGMGVEAMVH